MKKFFLILTAILILATLCGEAVLVNAAGPGGNGQSRQNLQTSGGVDLSTDQLVNAADTIAVGTVTGTASHWNAAHTLIVTDATVNLQNVLKGDKNLRQARITQPGGAVGGLTLDVSGAASLQQNEQAVLFLKQTGSGDFGIVGGKQGKKLVLKGKVNRDENLSDYTSAIEQMVTKSNSKPSRSTATPTATPTPTPVITPQVVTPVISSIQPASASAGTNTQVVINGSGFGTTPGSVNFYYQSGQPLISAPVMSWSDNSIVVTVPVGTVNGYSATASSGPVQVTTASGVSNNYQFGVTFSSMGVKWAGTSPQVSYQVNPSWVAGADTAVQAAAQTWTNAGASFSYVYGGTTTVTSPSYDGINEIMSGNLGAGVLASTYTWWNGANNLCEFDMVFNTYYPWSTTGAVGDYDVQSIATHELGHALGLRDLYGDIGTPNDMAKIMYGYGSTAIKRTLDPGDVAGIQWTYPLATPTAPVINISPTSFTFSATAGGSSPAGQLLTIQNSGGGSLIWTLSADQPWLTFNPASGVAGSSTTVGANISGMTAGSYSSTLTVAATGATNTPVVVPVTLTINPGTPAIGYNPSSLTFSASEGGANPANQTLEINNAGTGTLSWSATAADAWLSLSPASGSCSTTATPVTVGVNISGLAAGSYSSSITVTATGVANSPVTIPVNLTVNPPQDIFAQALDVTGLSFSTGGDAAWFPESNVYYEGGSAVQSGAINRNQSTWLTTTVDGPGTLSFYWKVSSRYNSGILTVYIDGVLQTQISGSVNWQMQSFSLSAGTHQVKWEYSRNNLNKTGGSNCGWLDKVQFN